MLIYPIFIIYLLTFLQFTNGFKLGSRGVSEFDSEDESTEINAGKPKSVELEDKLKILTNKEYLFGDELEDKPKNIPHKIIKNPALILDALEIGLPKNEKHLNNVQSVKDLLRQQRTNANENLFGEMNFQRNPSKFDEKDLFRQLGFGFGFSSKENDDSENENEMDIDEIKGPISITKEKIQFMSMEDLGRLYSQLVKSKLSKDLDSNSLEEAYNLNKPIIHYKEAFLSGKSYNDILRNGPKDENAFFQKISEKPFMEDETDLSENHKKYNRIYPSSESDSIKRSDYMFISIIVETTIAALLVIIAGGICWYTVNRIKGPSNEQKHGIFSQGNLKSTSSIKSNSSNSSGDRRLAQSAQMFHYQHQKQQMIAMEKANNETKQDQSDNSEGEAEEGDYTVYECPGLAPTGEMEVKNPLFKEDISVPNNNGLSASNSISSMPPAYSTVEKDTSPTIEKPNSNEINSQIKQESSSSEGKQ